MRFCFFLNWPIKKNDKSCSVPYQTEALDNSAAEVNTFYMHQSRPLTAYFILAIFCLTLVSCALETRKKPEEILAAAVQAPTTPLTTPLTMPLPTASHAPIAPTYSAPAIMTIKEPATAKTETDIFATCVRTLSQLKLKQKVKTIDTICKDARELPACTSVEGRKIFYFDHPGILKVGDKASQKILSFSLIHGDEEESAAVTLAWLERLNTIEPRNSWRVIPILNPDGWVRKTRTNAHGVDVNRNFPSKDWHDTALKYWKSETKENARRFPGDEPASEPETRCAMAQIDDFKPNFIISIHTPLGVLDFDGPKVTAPAFAPLPWVSLGNFPGSLGRYMWIDRGVPVLTVELKRDGLKHLEEFDRLQDATGTVAIQAEKLLKKKKAAELKPE